jgi:CRISPR-associated endonuclease/helicase Cas3
MALPNTRAADSASDPARFWAKSNAGGGAHSVPHHCLDVAAAGGALLAIYPPPVELPRATIIALLAFHDIGKFSRVFQAKVRELWPACLGSFQEPPAGYPHDQVGYGLLAGQLTHVIDPLFANWPRRGARLPILRAIAGHHGRPPALLDLLPRSVVCAVCEDAAREFITDVIALLDPPALPRLMRREADALAWWFAGFTIAADWVGSNADYFPPEPFDIPVTDYWSVARERAGTAVRRLGLGRSPTASGTLNTSALFPAITAPRPSQRWAETFSPLGGPCLIIVEDATGSGKTETAVVLTHKIMRAGLANGLYAAMPTLATANALYTRVADVYRLLFAGDALPSLVLAHGARDANAAFRASIAGPADPNGDTEDPDAPVAAQCARWIADDRRRAFLAEAGVGTIDQAVLGVLPSRHSPLRLLGLSRRVLIVDEAHAYDAYVSEELATLLTFHAAMGGSAIVLSATLTAKQRGQLINAWRAGIGAAPAPMPVTNEYPLITVASRAAVTTEHVTLAPGLARDVRVERVGDVDTCVDRIVHAAERGACVAWVRNAVDDVLEAASRLRAAGVDPIVFHARFAMGDRLAVEDKVLRRAGRASTPDERRGTVVVATQVIEQSLDLDFDLLVSDLAPADLIIQRAGRLWRHARDQRPIDGPTLLLHSDDPSTDPPADWGGPGRTRAVYRDPAVLWRGAWAIFGAGRISTPGNIRALVEAAYDDANTPASLQTRHRRATDSENVKRSVAGQNLLVFDKPYDREAGRWEPDDDTPTRLGDARVTVRLAIADTNGGLAPLCAHSDTRHAWRLSEISARVARLARGLVSATPAIEALRARWPKWDQGMPVIVLGDARNGVRAGQNALVTYSCQEGLRWL